MDGANIGWQPRRTARTSAFLIGGSLPHQQLLLPCSDLIECLKLNFGPRHAFARPGYIVSSRCSSCGYRCLLSASPGPPAEPASAHRSGEAVNRSSPAGAGLGVSRDLIGQPRLEIQLWPCNYGQQRSTLGYGLCRLLAGKLEPQGRHAAFFWIGLPFSVGTATMSDADNANATTI